MTATFEILAVAFPVFVSVIVWLADVPSLISPNVRFDGLAVSVASLELPPEPPSEPEPPEFEPAFDVPVASLATTPAQPARPLVSTTRLAAAISFMSARERGVLTRADSNEDKGSGGTSPHVLIMAPV